MKYVSDDMKKHYGPYWVEFEDGSSGCVDGCSSTDAFLRAEEVTEKTVKTVSILPYPASPVLYQHPCEYPCPPFCWSPKTCKGNTACPKLYACSE